MLDPTRQRLLIRSLAWLAVVCSLVGCAALPQDEDPSTVEQALADSAWARASDWQLLGRTPGWRHQRFGSARPTRYGVGEREGRPAVRALSLAGNSTLRLPLGEPVDPSLRLGFSWLVPQLNHKADLRDAAIDDAVVRVILTFDGDRGAFRPRDRWLSEIVQLVTGEPMPYATLMYVWDHRYPAGTVVPNPHTDRIRMLVVQSGEAGVGRWNDVERDVAADYQAAFGEAPGRLTGLGLMSDSNNTGESVEAWFGPVVLRAGSLPTQVAKPADLPPRR